MKKKCTHNPFERELKLDYFFFKQRTCKNIDDVETE